METLGKDVLGLIMDNLTPTDWWCMSLVCKTWSVPIQRWLNVRKKQFIDLMIRELNLYQIDLRTDKTICISPLYHLKTLGEGCNGTVTNHICMRHKILSAYGTDICEKCKKNPVSSNCFGLRCDGLKCRDYIYILVDGEAIKKQAYSCRVEGCKKVTDSPVGYCFTHAVELYPKSKEVERPKYKCSAKTKTRTNCTLSTVSRTSKCHHHAFSPVYFL